MKAYLPDSATPVQRARRAVVVGGGNVAMDAARCAMRLGAEHVYIVYRRSMEELPARREEVEHAMEEGVEFMLLTNPKEILGYNNPENKRDERNGFVTGMVCVKMELGEPDERGRRSPREIPGSEYISPILSLGIAVVLMVACIRQTLQSIHFIADKTVSEDTQVKIHDIISKNCDSEMFDSIATRYSQNSVCVDLCIKFNRDTQYATYKDIRDVLQEKLSAEIENCVVTIVIK
jgi:hypothetical protein